MRPGKRERKLAREAFEAKRAIIAHNLSSPKPEKSKLTSTVARDSLKAGTHTGFREPKGNLVNGRQGWGKIVDGRVRWGDKPQASHRFTFWRQGQQWGGCDNLAQVRQIWSQYRDRNFACIVRDERPYLDDDGKAAEVIENLNGRTVKA